jgi:serine/threonine protein kinase
MDLPDDPRLMQAVQEYLGELEAGRRPNRFEYLRKYADVAEPLGACLEGLELVHRTAGKKGSVSSSTAAQAPEFGSPELFGPLGDFVIQREIGRGGMGVVYEAVQVSLGRRVALKVLPFAAALDSRQLQRFKNEAQAAAHLNHPNIVPVYAIGCERGIHYYAMQLVEGQSLSELIASLRQSEARGPRSEVLGQKSEHGTEETVSLHQKSRSRGPVQPADFSDKTAIAPAAAALSTEHSEEKQKFFRNVAGLAIKAAEALQYAHEVGVVHRDIKPGNLLLDNQGTIWITDFGLAAVRTDATLTQTGEVMGTLRYMSPEQATGQRDLMDHRTDIYSLGATLYELLTLTPVFDGAEQQEFLLQIGTLDPAAPRTLDAAIPVDLETIVLKALNKSPEERYATAQALADDLRRFLKDQPIEARRPALLDRGRKWLRRHPALVGAAVIFLAFSVVVLAVSTILIGYAELRVRKSFKQEQKRAQEAEQRFELARRAADDMIQIADEELGFDPEQQALRQRLLTNALAYYQEFIELRSGDADAQADLEVTRARVERILNDLKVIHSAERHMLLSEPGVQGDLMLSADQRRQLAPIFQEIANSIRQPQRDRAPANRDEQKRQQLQDMKTHEEAIARILTPTQYGRLHQIAVQNIGVQAFQDPDIVAELKLSREQREQLRGLMGEPHGPHHGEGPGREGGFRPPPKDFGPPGSKDFGPPGMPPGKWEKGPGPGRPEPRSRPGDPYAMTQALAILNLDQLTKWKSIIGEPFLGSINGPPRRPGGPP